MSASAEDLQAALDVPADVKDKLRKALEPSAGWHAAQGVPAYLEDRAVAASMEGVDVVAIFDGHNGAAAAEFCAKRLPGRCAAAAAASDVCGAMVAAFREVNEEYIAQEEASLSAGTTAVVAVRAGEALHVANVGDSRALLCGAGAVQQLSVDHTADDEAELARIEAAGGSGFDAEDGAGTRVVSTDGVSMLAVSRSLGDRPFKRTEPPLVPPEPHACSQRLDASHSFVLLASDGVWDVMSNQRARDIVAAALEASASPHAAAARLCDAALGARSEDNVSAAVLVL